ncbi:MAG TPA: ABC transporter ATP-binding protein [Cytophagaceae bacterium]|jgi:subfamily B ATP-binding cassette protein MsbA|nr:ABC transporter ATP-binding protein [Cytophagaceae bacterium]
MKTYYRIIAYAKPFSRFAIAYAFFTLLAIAFGLINYSFLMPTLDILFDQQSTSVNINIVGNSIRSWMNDSTKSLISAYGKGGALVAICIILMISNLFTNIFKYVSLRIINRVRAVVVKNLRRHIFENITKLHLGYFSNERKGDLVSRLTNDVQEVENSVVSTLTVVFRDPATIIIYFVWLFVLSWKLTLITLVILPISGIIISSISKKLKKQSDAGQQSLGNILSIVDESISGLRVMIAFNARKYVLGKFDKENERYAKLIRSMGDKRELSSPLSEFLGVSVVAVILWIGGNMVFAGEMKPSEFFFYIICFYQILVPAKAISSSFSTIQRGLSSAERIFTIIDAVPEIQNSDNPKTMQQFNQEISFTNVSFTYGNGPILKNINLTISRGKTIALVGPSGGGKSTLADLIPRFYDVSKGEIKIDGINIKEYTLESLRNLMGIVTQESILFNDTIFNNIAFGKPHATEEEVMHAAKIANAHDFILKTENGYHTNIGDRGVKLSGGQRQRISIARAVLKNPPILILDEATSALDSESEKLVQEALTNLMKNRTSIVIAHRLSTIQHADEIIVLRKGEIEERGTHQSLLEKDGLYKKLHGHALALN